MTELFRESFDNLARWRNTATALSGVPTIIAGRNGNALRFTSSSGQLDYQVQPAEESDTFTIGTAVRLLNITAVRDVLSLRSDDGVTDHVHLRVNTNGSLVVTRGTSFTLGTTAATGLVAANTWVYLELQVKLHDTTGTAIVRVNGTERLNVTGLDTKNAGTKTVFDTLRLLPLIQTDYDDLYFKVGAGETFLGDIVVAAPTSQERMYRQQLRVLEQNTPVGPAQVYRVSNRVLVSLTTAAPGASVKAWNGSAFVTAPVKVWNGSAFVDAVAVKTWNGSAFV